MADNKLEVTVTGKDELSPMFQGLESRVIRFVGFVSSAIAAVKIAAFPVVSAASFERELANVKKTTNFTKTEVDDLSAALLKLSLTTDVSATDLAKIAAAAGQQGLGKEGVAGIVKFTDTVSRMASVLDITAEQAANDVGKILNIFKIPINEVERISSAINQVSNNSTAKGRELLDVLKRIGDAAAVAGDQAASFKNALALSATALDLGVSPEVAGTSFTKILANMKVKSKEFAQIFGESEEVFMKRVQEDGLKAYAEFLAKLRKMAPAEQARTISTLSGQGRVFSLQGKAVADTTDSVLNKNLALAQAGYASGTSSLKEQQTVMNTLISQVKVLGNSINKVGIEAGAPLLKGLTGYVIELQDAFNSEKFQSFFRALTNSLGDTIEKIASVIRWVAELNVNWNNFFAVTKILTEIKIAQWLLGITTRLAGMGVAAVGATASFVGLRAAQEAATGGGAPGAAGAAGAAKQVGVWGSLKQAIIDYRVAREAAAAADAELAAKQAALDRANGDRFRAQLAERDALQRKAQAENAVSSTANGVARAQDNLQSVATVTGQNLDRTKATAAASVQAAQAAANGRIMAEQERHVAAMQALQANYDRSTTTAELNRGRRALEAERATHAQITADLTAANARDIAAAEAAALRRIQIAEFEHNRVVALSQQRVAGTSARAAEAIQNDVRAGAGVAAAGAAVAGAGAAKAFAQNDLANAANGANAAGAAAEKAKGSLFNLGRAFTLLGSAISIALRFLGGFAIFATVVYSLLDALGILEKIAPAFQKLTDAIGLTSEASRKEADASRKSREELEKRAERVKELTAEYRKLLDIQGKLPEALVDGQADALKDTKDKDKAVALFGDVVNTANNAAQDTVDAKNAAARLPAQKAEKEKEFDQAEKALKKVETELKNAQELAKGFLITPEEGQSSALELALLEAKVVKLKKAYDEAKVAKDRLEKVTPESLAKNIQAKEENQARAEAPVAALVTPKTAPVLDSLTELRRAREEEERLRAEELEISKRQVVAGTKAEQDKQEALSKKSDEAAAATSRVQELTTKFNDLIKKVKELKDVSKNDLSVLDFFEKVAQFATGNVLNNANQTVKRIQVQAADGKKVPELTGAGVPKVEPKPPATGDGKGLKDKEADAEAKKLAKAQAELLKQRLITEANLIKQHNEDLMAEDDRLHARGLIALGDYYEERKTLLEANAKNDIRLKQNEIDVKEAEKKTPEFKESDRVRIDGEIEALRGQKQLLEEKIDKAVTDKAGKTTIQAGTISKQMKQEFELAIKQFNESRLQAKIDVTNMVGIKDVGVSLEEQLALITSQIEFRVNQLEKELENKRPGVTRALIDNFKLSESIKGLDAVFRQIVDKAEIAAGRVNLALSKIQFQQQRGTATDIDVERATNDANVQQAAIVKDKIEQQTKALDELVAKQTESTRATFLQSDAYKKQVLEIDVLKNKYGELMTATDQVALSINTGIGDAITKLIESLGEKSTGKLREFFKNINKVVLAEAQRMFVQDFVKKMDGIGGPGGFFSKLLNPEGTGGKQGVQPIAKDALGRTPDAAMYVRVVNKDGTPEQPKDSKADQGKPIDGAKTESVATPDVQTRDLEKAIETGTKKANEAYKLPGASNADAVAYLNDPANRKSIMADAEKIGALRNASKSGDVSKPADTFNYDQFRKATLDANNEAAKIDPHGRSDASPDFVKFNAVDKAELVSAIGKISTGTPAAIPKPGATGDKPLSDAEASSAADQATKDARAAVDTSGKDIGAGITGTFSKLGNEAKNGGLGLGVLAIGLTGALSILFSKTATTVQKFAAVATPVLTALVSNKAFTDGFGKTVKGLFGGSKPAGAVEIPKTPSDSLTPSIDNLLNNAVPKVGEAVDKVGETVSQEAAKVATDVTAPGTGIDGLFSTLGTGLNDGLSGLGDGATELFGSLKSTFGDLFSDLGGSLSGLGKGLSDMLSSLFSESGGGGGDGWAQVAQVAASFFHTGGVAGATHGRHSMVSPLAFTGAIRYHTGGIAGLQPNEVPAILQKGEEVLTASDPRHRDNGAMGGAGKSSPVINFNVSTPDANSFRKSKDQLSAQTGQAVNRALRRNM